MNSIQTEEFKISVSGGQVYVKKWSVDNARSDVPIVLMHDSLGCVALWRDFPESLVRNLSCPVVAYDRLGFGKSDPRSALPSLQFILEEATTYFPLIKAGLSISSYILLGHSVGGGMSLSIAANDADCKGVVTIAAQPFLEERTKTGILKVKNEFALPGQLQRLQRWHGDKARWVLDAWTNTWLSPDFAGWSLSGCIGNVRCPVLVIHGGKDEYGSTAFAQFIAARVGGVSKLLILEECGHMPHKEKPYLVIKAVAQFLNDLAPA
ncbi:MAG: alpha/beta fold hydrolase [Syntrophobacteraceae bacterium]